MKSSKSSKSSKKKIRSIKRTLSAQHKRRVHVYGYMNARRHPTGISVQMSFDEKRAVLQNGGAMIAWLPRAELRKLRTMIDRILGVSR